MKDTSKDMHIKFQTMMMQRSPVERLLMGCSMFDSAKQIVKSALVQENPKISLEEMREKLFLRFYGMEFSNSQKNKIVNVLKNID